MEEKPLLPSVANTERFFRNLGLFASIPEASKGKGFHSDLIRSLILNVDSIDRGRVTCSFTVKPSVTNLYNTMHGGAVGSVAEMMAVACARTAAGDKELFLGELSTAYLSAAIFNAEMEADARIIRQGRSVIAVSVEIRIKETRKLSSTSRVTFYLMPVASL